MKFALDAGDDSISSNFLNTSAGKQLTQKVNKESGKDSCSPSLSLKQRVIAFAVCTVLGILFVFDKYRSYHKFVVIRHALLCDYWQHFQIRSPLFIRYYSIALRVMTCFITCVNRSFFLSGPLNQLKKMFQKKRRLTSIVFLASIVMTLVSALMFKNAWLVLLFMILQYTSFFWYSLSYIPYGRNIFCKCFKNCFNRQQ